MVEVYDIIRKLDNFVVMCKHGTNEYVTYYTDGSSTSDTEHEYVDLGLPSGLKWATCNIGADSPEDYGYYFAWGGTEPQATYTLENCPFQTVSYILEGNSQRYSKYLGSTTNYYKDENATDEDALKTVLDPEDDAAHVNWGGEWRMPTRAEQDEIRNNCYWQWVTSYKGKSVSGYIAYKVKDSADKGKDSSNYTPNVAYSVSDSHIFFPAAGYRRGSNLDYADSDGYYWSSSLYVSGSSYAYGLSIYLNHVNWSYLSRCYGFSVRPVCH